MIDLERRYYLVRFHLKKDYERVVNETLGGPWILSHNAKWRANFRHWRTKILPLKYGYDFLKSLLNSFKKTFYYELGI